MPHESFLKKILPPLEPGTCYYTLSLGSGRPVAATARSIDAVLSSGYSASSDNRNAYFALASYRDDGSGRKKSSVVKLQSLWADIDAGKSGSTYANAGEAAVALKSFIASTGLTPTAIVSSGKGLHVYWALSAPVSLHEWLGLAEAFYRLCTDNGLDVDKSRARDAASVLRVPGTIHQSSGNPVRLLYNGGDVYDASDLAQRIGVAVVPEPPVVAAPASGFEFLDSAPEQYSDAAPVVKACPQLLSMGVFSYDQWFGGMTVLRRFKNGLEWAHKLSAMDKTGRYNKDDTDRKFYQTPDNSPMTCDRFASINPAVCDRCQRKGTVKSPVVLARSLSEAPKARILEIPGSFNYERVPFDVGDFAVDGRGMIWRQTVKTESGYQTREHVICDSRLYYKRCLFTVENNRPQRSYIFEAVHPNGKSEELRFVVDTDMSKYGVSRWFNNANMYVTDVSYTERTLLAFMNAYLRSVVHDSVELEMHSKFGWTDVVDPVTKEKTPGFVTGVGLVTDKGIGDAAFSPSVQQHADNAYSHAGDLEKWKEVPRMYKMLDQKVGQLFMCMSFAAPLMPYGSGEAKNAILNLWSRKSGMGKTRVLRAAASVWGNPLNLFFTRKESVVARCRRLAIWNNLPAFMDELTDNTDEELADLAYTLVGGMEKHKLRSSGAEFVQTGTWSTVSFASANRPFKEALSRQYGETDARLLRVMEYQCDFKSYDHDPELTGYINDCMDLCMKHYGLAGPSFIYNLLLNSERIMTLRLKAEKWVQDRKFRADERFMAYPLALAMICGRWAVEWGFLDYDMDELERWVMSDFVAQNRHDVDEYNMSSTDVMASFLNSKLGETLAVRAKTRSGSEPDPGTGNLPDRYVVLRPSTTRVSVRYEYAERNIYFSKDDFKAWCNRNGFSLKNVRDTLKEKGVKLYDTRMSLGKNVSWLPTPRVYAFCIDAAGVRALGYDMDVVNAWRDGPAENLMKG